MKPTHDHFEDLVAFYTRNRDGEMLRRHVYFLDDAEVIRLLDDAMFRMDDDIKERVFGFSVHAGTMRDIIRIALIFFVTRRVVAHREEMETPKTS